MHIHHLYRACHHLIKIQIRVFEKHFLTKREKKKEYSTMSNVPDKFYQVCRLCLAVVCDSDIPELSMYDISKTRSQAVKQQINNSVIISNASKATDETNALNHKNDSVHHQLAGDNKESIDCNASGLHNDDGNGDGVEDDDDESRIELHERIYTFLAITVSQNSVLFFPMISFRYNDCVEM